MSEFASNRSTSGKKDPKKLPQRCWSGGVLELEQVVRVERSKACGGKWRGGTPVASTEWSERRVEQ